MALFKKILPLAAILAVALPAGSAMAAPKSKFRFSQATYVVSEGNSAGLDVVVTRAARHGHSRINQASSVNYAITGGTATQGVDYTVSPAPGKLTFSSGESTKTLHFTLTPDTDIENLETINLKLSAATNNALITNPRAAQVLIADDDGPQQIQLAASSPTVVESAATADFLAVRSGVTTDDAHVDFATNNGTAVAPGDYTAQTGHLDFGPTDFVKTISVALGHDNLPENPEDFSVTLSNLTGLGATFPNGASSVTASTTIIDDDAAPRFQLDASSYAVNEDGSVDVTVNRLTTATAAQVSTDDVFNVTWATTDGSATNPADFVPGADQQLEFDSTDDAETITIAANDTDTQIGLVDDAIYEGDETFGLALTDAKNARVPGGSTVEPTLGDPSSATVTIHDNDTAPPGTDTGGSNTGGTGTTGTTGTTTNPGTIPVLGARDGSCGIKVSAAKKQKLLKQKVLTLKLRSSEACKVSLATTIKQLRSKSKKRQAQIVRTLQLKGKKASLTLQPGKAKTVKVKFTKKTIKALTKALRARKKLVATVVVTTRDSASHLYRKTLKITIRR